MRKIRVRIVDSARDGHILKWRDAAGSDRQCRCQGGTQRARETERRKLEKRLNERASELSWDEFWSLYDSDHLTNRSKSYRSQSDMMHRRLKAAADRRRIADLRCVDIDKRLILEVAASMRSRDVEESTVRSAMSTLWAMIAWGQDQDLIPDFRRPRQRIGKADKQRQKAKGRSLTGEEIERIEAAVPLSCKAFERPDEVLTAITAMRLIGMRLTECWLFSWEPMPGTHYPVRLGKSSAAVQFANVQKSGIESEVPLTNDAIDWLRALEQRRGESPWVCRTIGKRGIHKTPNRLGRIISDAGKRARVVVKRFQKKDGERIKYASAHDLRRTFATNLQAGLTISERQRLTRHSDAQTLIDHYLDAPTPVLVSKLREMG